MYRAPDKCVSLPSPPSHSDSLGGETSPLLLSHIVKFVHFVQCTVFGRGGVVTLRGGTSSVMYRGVKVT